MRRTNALINFLKEMDKKETEYRVLSFEENDTGFHAVVYEDGNITNYDI